METAGPLHVHHSRGGTFDGQTGHHGLLLEPHPHRPVAALGDVLIHALRCLPFRESLVMVDGAVGRGDMTLGFLRDRLPGRRNGRARQVLDWVDSGSESMVLRYYYEDVVYYPARMMAEVLAVLAGLNLPG